MTNNIISTIKTSNWIYKQNRQFVLLFSNRLSSFISLLVLLWFSFFLILEWMHDTARCLGYPSDSSRAATRRAGQAQPGWILPLPSPLASAAILPACAVSPFDCVGLISLRSSPMWLCSPTGWAVRILPRSVRPRS